jgi:hypothetical protein
VVVPDCRVLGGHGLSLKVGQVLALIFEQDKLRSCAENEDTVPYDDITAIEIGGPGATQAGAGFFGGGFGLQGAAEGMLIATALNMLTTRTKINTAICLQTRTTELFLHHGDVTPDALRVRLSPVFTMLRQRQGAESRNRDDATDHLVDRIAKLAELLDRGLISQAEFQKLKADALG